MKQFIFLSIVTGSLHASGLSAFITDAVKSSHAFKLSQLKIEQKKATLEHKSMWKNPQVEVAFDDKINGSLDMVSMELSQALPIWGEREATIKHSKALLKKAHYGKENTKLQVSYYAANLYRVLYQQKQKLHTLKSQRKEMKKLLNIIKKREQSGDVSGIERDRIEIGLYRLNVTIEKEKSHYLDLLLSAQTLLKKQKVYINAPIKHQRFKKIKQLSKNILKHPNINRLRAELDAKNHALSLAKTKAYPSPELFIYQEKEGMALAGTHEIYEGGIRLSIPLWNQNREAIEIQKVEKLKASESLNNASFKLKEQSKRYFKLYTRLKEQQYRYKKRVLSQSKKLYQLSKKLFESGEKSLLEMLDAQAFYFSSELEYNGLISHYDELYLKLCESLSINLLKDHYE